MLMFCNVGFKLLLRLLELMSEPAFVGHRFDKDTPIAETVRGSISEVDGIIS